MTKRSPITRAADFIEQEAELLRQCHTVRGDWTPAEADAQAEYNCLLALAAELRRMEQ